MRVKNISKTRRIIQIISLILIIYGGYIFKQKLQDDSQLIFPVLKAPQGTISTSQFEKGKILWPSGDTPVFENYPPSLICRFNPKGGMFKACIVHFLSENLTWRTSIKYLLPHLTLFVLLCFLLGRMWCGWICPLGTVGDSLTWLRRKMNVTVQRFPKKLRKTLRSSSYGLLIVTGSISAFIGLPDFSRFQCYWFLPYCQVCPARLICPLFGLIKPSWKDFSSSVSAMFTILAWIVIGIFIAAFYWGRRVWCHLCPVGLITSWFNKGACIELKKEAIKCNKCGFCADACPMGLTAMYEAEKNVIFNQNECIMCLRCVEICPKDKCLSMSFLGKKIIESNYVRNK